MILEPNPSYGGGSEAMTLTISRGLAEHGHKVCLLHEIEGSMLPAYREFATEIFQMHLPGFSLHAPLSSLSCALRIGRLAQKHRVNAVLSGHLGFIRMGALVRGLYGIPFCFHLGLPAFDMPHFSRAAYRWIGAGVAPSQHTRESWYRAGWPSGTLVTIPNWVDTDRFRPTADRDALRQHLGIPRESRCIVFVGRICPEKGVEVLIDAFSSVLSKVENANLVVVGEPAPGYGKRFFELIDKLDHDTRRRILLTGVSSTPEKYFAVADIACVPPSWNEPFGLTLLEAMASALPVIATTVGIFPQIIGEEHRDLLVSPDDPTSLAERLVWWLTRPDAAQKRGLQLRQRVIQNFGHRQATDAYENILNRLIADAPSDAGLIYTALL